MPSSKKLEKDKNNLINHVPVRHGYRYRLSGLLQFLRQWIERAYCPIRLVLSSLISNNAILIVKVINCAFHGLLMTLIWIDLKLVLFSVHSRALEKEVI
jgi:hypothetical protein